MVKYSPRQLNRTFAALADPTRRRMLRQLARGEHQLNLEAAPMKQAAQWVEEYRKFWEGSLDRLADYLEKTNKKTQKKSAP